ncbi:DNA helicase-2/ATP-dependent DNA helicase PcrA [Stella humosa]|uniref:DNA 3'-5' helicase n=1 Tax=Stella humosa TaxID=94 RepID=A0A3N1LIE9_9PROT|nr:ATP-dependent helicase [Stella humosa]ROP90618.1 DNA helicase-2/ATP-dependent DNA helicase PcrA [Stella humosa]BBK29486.1 DNA helicase [Stella humosa]
MIPRADPTARDTLLESLNPQQQAAVLHGEGPLLVIAGAGSGKTSTLAHRVARLVADGADPRRLLLLTFSRRAAAEMGRRVERLLARLPGPQRASLSWSGTFHGIGARLLREQAECIGLAPGFTILDREDAADLMGLVRHEQGLSGRDSRFPLKATCLAVYSRAVNAEAELETVLDLAFPWVRMWEAELRRLFAGYVEAKQRQQVLDYDDLLLYWAQMMLEPEIAAEIGGRFDHVLVDEYQDTNRLQASILTGLKPDGRGVTVVGDDAQAIYSFRAATNRNILDFPGLYRPPARILTLERNYRSTGPILAASNAVIALAPERYAKDLWSDRLSGERPQLVTVRDEADQARCVAERILAHREAGLALKEQAVLFRTSHHSGMLEVELVRRNIPFVKFGGLKFLDSAHVKDLLALLRWIENPRDRVAGFRVLQILPGIGPAIAGRLLDRVAEGFDPELALAAAPPPARAEALWPDFVALVGRLHRRAAGWPAEMADARSWYDPLLAERHADAAARAADLVQLEQIAAGYASRERFLTELTLDPPGATSDEAGVPLLDEDYLILSTIHSAKGQEWTAVHVLNVVDGCMPSDLATGRADEIEEERRLLYVAMTRARDHLALMLPHRFYTHQQAPTGDRYVHAARTRFLPPALLPLFEEVSWPPPARPTVVATDSTRRAVDIAARLRAIWR